MAARAQRRALADDRALEEEAERYNPVNPKKQMGTRRGRTSLVATGDEYSGAGATPSMGLSQFRGGASPDEPGEHLIGAGKLVITHGSGTKKGQMRKTARKAYEGKSEAHEMGRHLSEHLHSLHGAGFWDDFKSGFMSVVRPVAGVAKSLLPLAGPEGMAASGVMGALGLGKKRRGKGATGAGATGAGRKRGGRNTTFPGGAAVSATEMEGSGLLGQDGHGQYQGSGFLSDLGIPIISNLAGAIGLGHEQSGCGATGAGKGGRSARAAIVKKVMADRGVSMIEASKIVKSEGLY
jgi:hypothetical protein